MYKFIILLFYVVESLGQIKFVYDPRSVDSEDGRLGHAVANYDPTVNTTSGVVRGTTWEEAHAFYEIPYAQPPVGDLRFQPPQATAYSPEEIDASTNQFRSCWQLKSLLNCIIVPNVCAYNNMNEDCLVLNVFVPSTVDLSDQATPPSEALPVMFYIHGGAFLIGSGTSSEVEGRWLANVTNTIVVTINYRLGALGFLVQGEGVSALKGNQGIKDQQLALQWVQDNIHNFGGDKTEVTIFGSSAGAQSVMFHFLSNVSAPLFTRGILQSNPTAISYRTTESSKFVTEKLTSLLRCQAGEERECLMAASAENITSLVNAVNAQLLADYNEPYRPVIDEVEFTDQPLDSFRDGKWNSDKELIIGVTTEELLFQSIYRSVNETQFQLANQIRFGEQNAQAIKQKYDEIYQPLDGDYSVVSAMASTHHLFACSSRLLARFASVTSTTLSPSVYFYADDHPVVDLICVAENNGNTSGCRYFATHSSEVGFIFRTGEHRGYNLSNADLNVENQFSTYWGGFARTGDPSGGLETPLGTFPTWPPYTNTTSNGGPWRNIRIQSPTSEIEEGYEENICDFWDGIGYYLSKDTMSSTETTTTVDTETMEVNVSSSTETAETVDTGMTDVNVSSSTKPPETVDTVTTNVDITTDGSGTLRATAEFLLLYPLFTLLHM